MFTATLLLLAILAGWIVWETVALSVKYVDIPIKGLPPEFDGFRFAQVSDLHGKLFDPTGREAQATSGSRGDSPGKQPCSDKSGSWGDRSGGRERPPSQGAFSRLPM